MGVGSDARGGAEPERVEFSEILKEKLYFAPLQRVEDTSAVVQCLPKRAVSFNIDSELVYEPFFAEFGPLNLACTYRFCWKLHHLLKQADEQEQCVLFCCSADPKRKSNAAVLLGAYLVLFCGAESDAAYSTLSMFEPLLAFRDPTCGISTYRLTVLDCIRAVLRANRVGWIDFNNFNLEEYEYFEQVENGDLNWIVPNKLMAFSGPSAKRLEIYGYRTLVPEDYVEYFHRVGITGIIRLNRKAYDRRRFTDHGLAHYDLYFPDGSCPPDRILRRFLEIVEETSGALAVHCKAGLGRTGALLGCYIMKHYRFTCNETLGYLRIVRPGSVIGPQQHYLKEMQFRMWKAGDVMRHQMAQMNSNQPGYNPSRGQATEQGSVPNGWTQPGNNKVISSRRLSTNPNCRRGSMRDREEGDRNRSPPASRSNKEKETGASPQRVRRKSAGATSPYAQGAAAAQDEAASGSSQFARQQSPSPGSRGQSGAGVSNVASGMGRLCVNEPESSGSGSAKKVSRESPLRTFGGTISSTRSSSTPQYPAAGENLGILQNATGQPAEANQFHGSSVVVRRVINSAGQPRKVVRPVAELVRESFGLQLQTEKLLVEQRQQQQQQHHHQPMKFYDISPTHHRGYNTSRRLITAPSVGPSKRDYTYNPM